MRLFWKIPKSVVRSSRRGRPRLSAVRWRSASAGAAGRAPPPMLRGGGQPLRSRCHSAGSREGALVRGPNGDGGLRDGACPWERWSARGGAAPLRMQKRPTQGCCQSQAATGRGAHPGCPTLHALGCSCTMRRESNTPAQQGASCRIRAWEGRENLDTHRSSRRSPETGLAAVSLGVRSLSQPYPGSSPARDRLLAPHSCPCAQALV